MGASDSHSGRRPESGSGGSAGETVALGDEIAVSRLGLGAMRITGRGVWGAPADEDEARRLLRRAVELGVSLIDTADSYGPEVSEQLVAGALGPYPAGLVIATKGGLQRPGPGQWRPDARPEHLRAACEGSLRRLGLDRIDLYQLHAPDPRVPMGDSVGALAELRAEGKIREIGLCNVDASELELARSIVPIVSVQNRFSFDRRDSESLVEICEQQGIAFLPWAPLGGSLRPSAAVRRLAVRHGVGAAQIAIAWLLSRSPAIAPIPGTGSIDHLEQNIAAAALRLSPQEMLDASSLSAPERLSREAQRAARALARTLPEPARRSVRRVRH